MEKLREIGRRIDFMALKKVALTLVVLVAIAAILGGSLAIAGKDLGRLALSDLTMKTYLPTLILGGIFFIGAVGGLIYLFRKQPLPECETCEECGQPKCSNYAPIEPAFRGFEDESNPSAIPPSLSAEKLMFGSLLDGSVAQEVDDSGTEDR